MEESNCFSLLPLPHRFRIPSVGGRDGCSEEISPVRSAEGCADLIVGEVGFEAGGDVVDILGHGVVGSGFAVLAQKGEGMDGKTGNEGGRAALTEGFKNLFEAFRRETDLYSGR